MTTVITRLYADEKAAAAAKRRLWNEGFPEYALQIISSGDNAASRMVKAEVPEDMASVYAAKMSGENSLLVVRATYKPLGAARIAREILAKSETIAVGLDEEEAFVPDRPEKAPSILKGHPRFFMLLPLELDDLERGTVSERIGLRLLSPRKSRNSAIPGGKRFLTGALKRRSKPRSAIHGGAFMSQKFWPMPLVSTGRRRNSVIPGGGKLFSRAMGWPTIS